VLNKYSGHPHSPWYNQLYNHKVLGTTSSPTSQFWVQSVLQIPYSYCTGFNQYNIHPVMGSTSTPTTKSWVQPVPQSHNPRLNQYFHHSVMRCPVLPLHSSVSNQYVNVTVVGSTSSPITQSWVRQVLQRHSHWFNLYFNHTALGSTSSSTTQSWV